MIELITGSPGAGKTTFAVAVRLAAEAGREVVTEDGDIVKRRVVVAGVKGLLIEHEVLPHRLTADEPSGEVVARYNAMRDDLPDTPVYQRLAGSASDRECPCLVQNWWLWCKPGDLIVVDEVQFMAPRGSLGKKPPYWIEAMAVHRHYGVDFLIITQHPQLIDAFIRNLVGMHRHVRSMLGSALCTVYVWDHASNPERFSLANKGFFWRRAKHYRLFKSSVAHVKPPTAGRGMLLMLPVLAIGIVLGVMRFKSRFMGEAGAAPAVATVASAPAGSAPAGRPGEFQGTKPVTKFPFYEAVPIVLDREPFSGRAVQLEGSYKVGAVNYAVFGLLVDGERIATATLAQLVRMGYSWTDIGPCAGVLRFGTIERVVTCGKRSAPAEHRDAPMSAAAPASAPS
jgi:zona occludens toxin (predicted ATPase)